MCRMLKIWQLPPHILQKAGPSILARANQPSGSVLTFLQSLP